MTAMISLQDHEYAGVPLREGDAFDAEDKDVVILSALGRARVKQGQEYITRNLSGGMIPGRARRGPQKAS